VDPAAFVAPTATLIGDVTIEAGASVWFDAVLRADYGPVVVREGANVQDFDDGIVGNTASQAALFFGAYRYPGATTGGVRRMLGPGLRACHASCQPE